MAGACQIANTHQAMPKGSSVNSLTANSRSADFAAQAIWWCEKRNLKIIPELNS